MEPHWTVYSEVVENVREEEPLNDCFAELIEESLTRDPAFVNHLLDGLVEFGDAANVEGTQRNPLPFRNQGTDRELDFTIGDASKLVGFESKRGGPLNRAQLQDELEKLEYNAGGRKTILVTVTEHWRQPEIVSTYSDQITWIGWRDIARQAFNDDELDETWNPTFARAQKLFNEFGIAWADGVEAEDWDARIEAEQRRWADRFVAEFRPDSWGDEWTAKSRAGHIFKEGWRLDANFDPTTRKAPVALQFVHHLRNYDLVKRGELKFQFRWDGGTRADLQYRDRFAAWFREELYQSDIDLSSRGIQQIDRANVFTEKTYEFDVNRFPTAYYETLREAFEEHQVLVDFMAHREEVADIVQE